MGQVMNNLPLQPLVWTEISEKVRNDPSICELDKGALWIADDNLIFRYNIKNNPNSKELPFIVNYGGRQPKEVDSVEYGKHWAEFTHYASHMQPYVKPDSITDIANWFKAAKPEPTIEDLCVQIGCMLEEVCEFLEPLGFLLSKPHDELLYLADGFKSKQDWAIRRLAALQQWQRIDIIDACCDINVTSVGVMQLLGGVDVLGAQREVVRSNNSKMVDGKFIFNDNGKIAKPDSYSEPDLTPFISTMQNLHKGE